MAVPFFSDIYKLFYYATKQGPLEALDGDEAEPVGVSSPDARWDIRSNMWGGPQSPMRIETSDSQDFIDLSTVTNRKSRYKEYERLENIPEIHTALNTFADEACLAGSTKVATPLGFFTIKKLAEEKDPDERFMVYCWDFDKRDFALGWAYNPRKVKTAETVEIKFDNGIKHVVTPDHGFLMANEEWREAGNLKYGDKLKPFYRLPAAKIQTKFKTQQYPRVFTFSKGWVHERQFLDEWKADKELDRYKKVDKIRRYIARGLNRDQTVKASGFWRNTIEMALAKEGFTYGELRKLHERNETERTVVGVSKHKETEVYDLSVENHANFATNATIVHNCQTDDEGRVFKVKTSNEEVKEEIGFLLHKLVEMDDRAWGIQRSLCKLGDHFFEIVIDPHDPKAGIKKLVSLPGDSMYRIETVKGRLVEFQQSQEGPDYQALSRTDITKASQAELMQATALRFHPEQIVHARIGDDRKTFYPYGISVIEAARGPAHQLRLMEDAMLVYRLCLTGDSRVRTNQGWKYIKDIAEGDDVFSLQHDEGLIPAKVSWFVNNGVQDVYQVRSDHVEIKGTKTHPILVSREGVVQMIDIQDLDVSVDKIVNVTHDVEEPIPLPIVQQEKWVRLQNANDGVNVPNYDKDRDDYLLVDNLLQSNQTTTPTSFAKRICNEFGVSESDLTSYPSKIPSTEDFNLPLFVNEDFAKLMGFLIGDGSIRESGNMWTQLCFSSGEHSDANEYYANLLKQFFGKAKYEEEKRYNHHGKFVASSKWACFVVLAMGYIPGAKNKRIPKWVFNAHKEIRKAFVCGLADADGHIRNLPSGLWTCEFSMCNKKLVEDIKELWHGLGLCSGQLRYRKRNGGHEIEPGRKMPSTDSYELYISERELPKYEKLRSIIYAGKEEVYDFEVNKQEHNFVVNGAVVSNTRAPERRVFYVDVGQISPSRAEAFVDRLKDQFRKKKVFSRKRSGDPQGASAVEERWNPMGPDEDFFLPIRPNSATRIETLPGAENLGEIDDALYFRQRLFTALQFPKNYLTNEDPQATRLTLSQQDVRFARLVERLQKPLGRALLEIAKRHLKLRGFPPEAYDDLEVRITPPSDWRQINRNEVTEVLYGRVATVIGSQLMSRFDALTKILGYDDDEAREIVARAKAQQIDDLKLQIIGQNPDALGLTTMPQTGTEIGAGPGGPAPILAPPPPGGAPPGVAPGAAPGGAPGAPGAGAPPATPGSSAGGPSVTLVGPEVTGAGALPEPSEDDIKKYDLEIEDANKEVDEEEIDVGESEGEI